MFDGQRAGVLWQAPASGKLYVTWFSAAFDTVETIALPHDDKMALAGRGRGNEAGRPPLALMVVPLPDSAWGA